MDKLERLQIQWDKVKKGYQTMTTDEIAALREKVLFCFDSEEMRNYLRGHFEELSSWDLIRIIVGAQKPLEYKVNLMAELAERFPHPFEELDDCYDFEVYAKQYQQAFTDMQITDDEQAIYLLRCMGYDEVDNSLPFFKFEDARNYIKTDDNDNPDFLWYEIEKWDGFDNAGEKCTYKLSLHGEIWDYRNWRKDTDLYHTFGDDLNLPVPFSVGDVVTIDCRPSAPISHIVILEIGDNHDCCCVQGLYVKENGLVNHGALKHSHAQDFMRFSPQLSPLYRAERFRGELPPEEAFMKEFGDGLSKLYQSDPQRYENEGYKWYFDFVNVDRTPQELMERLREVSKEWGFTE